MSFYLLIFLSDIDVIMTYTINLFIYYVITLFVASFSYEDKRLAHR